MAGSYGMGGGLRIKVALSATDVRVGSAALLLSVGLWGSNPVVARAIHHYVPLPALVFWRWAIAVMLLLFLFRRTLREEWPTVIEHRYELALLGAIGVGGFSVLQLYGAYSTLAADVGIISATTPVWVGVILVITRVRSIYDVSWSGIFLALMGIIIIILKGDLVYLEKIKLRTGSLSVCIASVAFAWFSVRVQGLRGRVSSVSLMVATSVYGFVLVAFPFYVASSLLSNEPWPIVAADQTTFSVAAVMYIAIGPTLAANLFYIIGVNKVGAERGAAFLYLSPIVTVLLSAALLKEEIHIYHVVGIALVLAGLAIVGRKDGMSLRL